MEKTQLFDTNNNPINLGGAIAIAEGTVTTASTAAIALGTLLGGTVLADAIAAGASIITVTIETTDFRVSWLNNDPSANGQLYAKGNGAPYAWNPSSLTKIKVASQGGTGTLRYALFA